MREILFRGKRTDNGEWVEGWYVYGPKNTGSHFIVSYNAYGTILWYEVDPATVGQYVGRGDKNDKRIFEGDIVEYQGRRYAIAHYDGWAMYMLHGKTGGTNGMYTPLFDCIVIGNIHDNPELLEKEAESHGS